MTRDEAEARIKRQFESERVSFGFSSVTLRADRVYVSKAQAQSALQRLEALKNVLTQASGLLQDGLLQDGVHQEPNLSNP